MSHSFSDIKDKRWNVEFFKIVQTKCHSTLLCCRRSETFAHKMDEQSASG